MQKKMIPLYICPYFLKCIIIMTMIIVRVKMIFVILLMTIPVTILNILFIKLILRIILYIEEYNVIRNVRQTLAREQKYYRYIYVTSPRLSTIRDIK